MHKDRTTPQQLATWGLAPRIWTKCGISHPRTPETSCNEMLLCVKSHCSRSPEAALKQHLGGPEDTSHARLWVTLRGAVRLARSPLLAPQFQRLDFADVRRRLRLVARRLLLGPGALRRDPLLRVGTAVDTTGNRPLAEGQTAAGPNPRWPAVTARHHTRTPADFSIGRSGPL